ncbi:MAG TPA: DUF5681 domain-containing protein [Alphaproteobacteria bacterium]|nr:DUF5681 domain-containing protein [Alphaproteobacteria bacterium]
MTDNTTTPENTGEIQDTRFKPGQSGNPAGKPKGTRHKATQAMMVLLEGETEALTRKAIEKALEGDTAALRICLDRISPAPRSAAQCIDMDLPSGTLTEIARAFVTAAAAGKIPPDIAAQLVSAVASVAKVEEMENVKERLEALERAIKEKKP